MHKQKTGEPGLLANGAGNVTIESGATITGVDVSNTTAIQVTGSATGTIGNEGAISLSMTFTPTAEGNTGIAGGPFATGDNRIGIDVASGTLTGSIANTATGTTTIDGNSSVGIQIAVDRVDHRRP